MDHITAPNRPYNAMQENVVEFSPRYSSSPIQCRERKIRAKLLKCRLLLGALVKTLYVVREAMRTEKIRVDRRKEARVLTDLQTTERKKMTGRNRRRMRSFFFTDKTNKDGPGCCPLLSGPKIRVVHDSDKYRFETPRRVIFCDIMFVGCTKTMAGRDQPPVDLACFAAMECPLDERW